MKAVHHINGDPTDNSLENLRRVDIRTSTAHRFAWWIDYHTLEVVRTADGQRWRVEDVTPLNVQGAVDVEAVDRWVLGQPEAR